VNEPRIKILSEDLINKIAAGEVVERPASVVKELVENSIDAGATQVVVEIQDAGKKLIRVSDNGRGMPAEEIKIALQRHSTSKIGSLEDLFNIQTLGFRGEALPSIASVSRMKIDPNPSGSGITAEAKDLFYNTPARKKFLKSNLTEIGHIGEIIAKYAMAFPGTAFKFTSDGKPLISSPGTGKLMDALAAIYGPQLTKELVPVDSPFPGGKVSGFASRPTFTRVDKNYETFYVNQRFIRNFLLNRALEEAYRTLIPNNRYPIGVLFIDIDPRQVDVNVHPTKREVKFQKTNEVLNAVTAAVKQALSDSAEVGDWVKGAEASIEAGSKSLVEGFFDQLPMTNVHTGILTQSPSSALTPICQFKQTYILATDGEELVLIDQHAAHERVLYDQLSRETQGANHQSLLIPETVEFVPTDALLLRENQKYFGGLGFEIEEFGNNTFILRSVPAISSKIPARQLLTDIVSDLRNEGKAVQLDVRKENLRKLVACHSAIKAGDKLTPEEMLHLIKDLYNTPHPFTCPHGRPTMIRLAMEEISRRFGRYLL
jgi:DNA mismatch repair protein MutL